MKGTLINDSLHYKTIKEKNNPINDARIIGYLYENKI